MSDATAKKEERRKFQAIKGTRDLLPPETELWNRVEQTAHDVFSTFSFGEIRVPIFEPTGLFARSIGAETDVVSKEMYSFETHDDPYFDGIAQLIWALDTIHDKVVDHSGNLAMLIDICSKAADAFKRGTIPSFTILIISGSFTSFGIPLMMARCSAKGGGPKRSR